MAYEDGYREISLGKKIAAGVAAATVVAVPTLTVLSTEKTPADKIALSYGGGPFEGNQYQRTVQPGSSLTFNGFFDKWYEYPVTLRNYIVSSSKDEGDKESFDVIKATDGDGVEEQIELTVSFKLNTELVRKFHERVGMKYEAWDEDGWRKMLADNMRQPLNNAVNKAMKGFTTEDIKKNPEVIQKIEAAIEAELSGSLTEVMGDQYFCGPESEGGKGCGPIKVVVKGITPTNPEVSKSFEDQKKSANGIQVAKNEAQQQIERAEGEKAAKDAVAEALTPEYLAYIRATALLKCAEKPDCTIIVSEGGAQTPQLTLPAIGR